VAAVAAGRAKDAAPSEPPLRSIGAATSATGKGRARGVAPPPPGRAANRGCRPGPRAPWSAQGQCSCLSRRPGLGVRTRFRRAPGAARALRPSARPPRREARTKRREREARLAEQGARGARVGERREREARVGERGAQVGERAGTIRPDGRHRARHPRAPGPATEGGYRPALRAPGWGGSLAAARARAGRPGQGERTTGARGWPVHPSQTRSAAAFPRLARSRNYDSRSTGYSLYP
jgi:hypothetical protein